MGALQELDRAGELGRAAYLSAVSGGSYITAAHEIVRARSEDAPFDPALGSFPFAPGSPEEEYLRNRTCYLAPGARGKLALFWRLLRGLAVNLFVIGGAVTLAGFTYGFVVVHRMLPECLPKGTCVRPPEDIPPYTPPAWVWWFIGLTFSVAVLFGVVDILWRPRRVAVAQFLQGWSLRAAIFGLLLIVALVAIPWSIPEVLRLRIAEPSSPGRYRVNLGVAWAVLVSWWTLFGTVAGVFSLRSLGFLGAKKTVETEAPHPRERPRSFWSKTKTFAFHALVAIVGPVLLAIVFSYFVFVGAMQRGTRLVWVAMAVTAAVLAVVYWFGDLTRWSMHPFYKRRLCSAFVLQRTRRNGRVVVEEVPYDDPVHFGQLRDRPTLVVCAAANVSDYGATPANLSAVPFTMSRDEVCGGQLLGGPLAMHCYAEAFPKNKRNITVPTAVAISGAALSPSMGKQSRPWLRFLLAVANVRLGVWLPNPRAVRREQAGGRRVRRKAGPHYLLWELLGWNSYLDDYIYVTDGGHVENLGLVELLRLGCTDIYCFDASGDEIDTFNTLGQAIAMARSELGVEIEIDPFEMAPKEDRRFVTSDHVTGEIWFAGDREAGRRPGRIVVAKAGVVADAPADIRAFMGLDPEFPTHGTASQLYAGERFEEYRALGAFTARRAIAAMKAPVPDGEPGGPLETLLTRLKDWEEWAQGHPAHASRP